MTMKVFLILQEREHSMVENLRKQMREVCDDDLLLLAFNSTLQLVDESYRLTEDKTERPVSRHA